MKKIFTLVLLATLATISSLSQAGKLEVRGGQMDGSKYYTDFLQRFRGEILTWEKKGGGKTVSGRWAIFVYEFTKAEFLRDETLRKIVGGDRSCEPIYYNTPTLLIYGIRDDTEGQVPTSLGCLSPKKAKSASEAASLAVEEVSKRLTGISTAQPQPRQ